MEEVKEVLKTVKKIEIRTRMLVEGLIQGYYHSVFKGRGIEFSEVREYFPGDDIRTIDWNVTARMNAPFVKEFIEERDLTVYIMFDMSGSGDFGSEKSKRDSAVELAASLMFSALNNNDRVGLCIFTDRTERFISPKKGKKHVLRLIRELITFEPRSRKTDIKNALRYVSRVAKKRSIIFILSDFFSSDFEKHLKILKKRHDIIAVNLKDIREYEIPDIGYIYLEDSETGEQVLVNTSDPEFRKQFSEAAHTGVDNLSERLRRMGIDLIQLRTGENFSVPLKNFFKLRARRIVR